MIKLGTNFISPLIAGGAAAAGGGGGGTPQVKRWFKFDETGSPTLNAIDSVGLFTEDFSGSSSFTSVAGKLNTARKLTHTAGLSFSGWTGSDVDIFRVLDNLNAKLNRTFTFWVKFEASCDRLGILGTEDYSGTGSGGWCLAYVGNDPTVDALTPGLYWHALGTRTEITSASNIINPVPGDWYFICITADSSGDIKVTLPYSFTDDNANSFTSPVFTATWPTALGSDSFLMNPAAASTDDVPGVTYDELRVYNDVLTLSQLQSLYATY